MYLCWLFAVEEAANAIGATYDKFECYRLPSGQRSAVSATGASLPAFDELAVAISVAGMRMRLRVHWFDGSGWVRDFDTFDQLLLQGRWFVIAGGAEQVLQPGQVYGHYLLARQISGSFAGQAADEQPCGCGDGGGV